ncbi:ribonuclease HI [Catellatospora aurea]|uniref:Ribonuclease HI n=1 Tax=Catellatospora aurea TaxID=1337874 RepID=A0ABW2H7E2_9ACTN
MTDEDHELMARLCGRCNLVVLHSGADQWVHQAAAVAKFTGRACDGPVPGRPAKPREVRFGLGTDVDKDAQSLRGVLPGFQVAAGEAVILGTDGAYKEVTVGDSVLRPLCWGYIADNGIYGCGAARIPGRIVGDRVLQTELRAIWWSLRELLPTHPTTIVSDSQDAIELVEDWRHGGERMPRGYTLQRVSDRKATILQLAHLVTQHADLISTQWVRGHSGYHLNEGADALAKIARLWATKTVTKDQVRMDAENIARDVLARHRARTGTRLHPAERIRPHCSPMLGVAKPNPDEPHS